MSKEKFSNPGLQASKQPPLSYRIDKLDIGLVAAMNVKKASQGAATAMDGVRFDQEGLRPDFSLSSMSTPFARVVQGIHNHIIVKATAPFVTNRLVAVQGDAGEDIDLMIWNGSTWTNSGTIWNAAASASFTGLQYVAIRTVLETLFFCINTLGYPKYWNESGGTFLNVTSLGYHRDVIEFADRAVFLGSAVSPTNIQFSVSGDVTDVTGEGSGSLDLIGGPNLSVDAIRGGAKIGNNLAIFRQRSVYRAFRTGNIDQAIGVSPWLDGIGTESQFSICTNQSGILFLGHDKMPYFMTESGIRAIGKTIYPWLRDTLDVGAIDMVDGSYDPVDQRYHLGIPEGSAGNITAIISIDMARFISTGEESWTYRTQAADRIGYTTF